MLRYALCLCLLLGCHGIRGSEPSPSSRAALLASPGMPEVESWLLQWRQERPSAPALDEFRALYGFTRAELLGTPDLDGDRQSEWVVLLAEPTWERAHDLWIVGPGRRVYRVPAPEHSAQEPRKPPRVAAIADLSGDGRDDLVITRVQPGAHTPTLFIQVITGHHGRVESALQTGVPSRSDAVRIANGSVEIIGGNNGSTAELHITGGWFNSVGPVSRPRREIWTWNGQALEHTRTEPLPEPAR